MGKWNQLKKQENVILFPNLEKRLLEKGVENLHQKNYHEAIALFEHAIKLDPFNSESHMGLVLAYFEAGMVDDAKQMAKQMLQDGIGEYIETMNVYLMMLIQTNNYEEAVKAIEGLLQETNIPHDKLEHFYRMLDFSRRMVDEQTDYQFNSLNEFSNNELDLFRYHDPQEQMMLVAKLSHQNIQPYLHEILSYLQSTEGGPFFKTLLLNVLKEHRYDKMTEIQKFEKYTMIIPETLPEIYENTQFSSILKIIGEKLENDDPVLFENIKSLMKRQFFLLYPFQLELVDVTAWAAAYHVIGNEYYGNINSESDLREEYQVLQADMEKADSFIRMIEEISSPNI